MFSSSRTRKDPPQHLQSNQGLSQTVAKKDAIEKKEQKRIVIPSGGRRRAKRSDASCGPPYRAAPSKLSSRAKHVGERSDPTRAVEGPERSEAGRKKDLRPNKPGPLGRAWVPVSTRAKSRFLASLRVGMTTRGWKEQRAEETRRFFNYPITKFPDYQIPRSVCRGRSRSARSPG